MKEEDKIPAGLTIEDPKEACNITITLGDDVNLKQIVDYLVVKEHIKQVGQDKKGIFYKPVNNATITIKMCSEDQNDTYNVTMMPDENNENVLFMYNNKYKTIDFDGDRINKNNDHYRFICENNRIKCDNIIDSKKLLKKSMYILVKDIKGHLSWCKTTTNGKIYMCNAKDEDGDPENISEDKWKPIQHTFWSNIHDWYWHNFDEFDDEIKKQTSKIKRFGRLFIGQQNMTGNWLCGKGCCSCTPSGYNEYDFYEEKQNDNKKSGNNINDNLSQNNNLIFDN